MLRNRTRPALIGILAAVLLSVTPALADPPQSVTVDGIRIDWGVEAGSQVAASGNAVDQSMHGGEKRGPRDYHLTVSLTDLATGKQVPDAKVEADMYQIGLDGPWKSLQPMAEGGTYTYGNYFKMNEASPLPYRIALRIHLPGQKEAITAEFTHDHE